MKIIISNNFNVPLYRQIETQIRESILKGDLAEGDVLPSIRTFASDLGVSVLTIRRVYNDLEAEGFIVSQAGLGTFVSTGNPELLKETKRRMVEEKMQELIQMAKSLRICKDELHEMMEILYEEEDEWNM